MLNKISEFKHIWLGHRQKLMASIVLKIARDTTKIVYIIAYKIV